MYEEKLPQILRKVLISLVYSDQIQNFCSIWVLGRTQWSFRREIWAETFYLLDKSHCHREYKPAASGMLSNCNTKGELKICSSLCLSKNCRVVTILYIIITISLIVYLLWIMHSVCIINNMTVCPTAPIRKTQTTDKWKQKQPWLLRTIKHYTASRQGEALEWFNGAGLMMGRTFG